MTTWRDRVREAWKDLPEVPDGMQEAFDLGLVDGAPGYGDWLRTPYRVEDCEVDGILLAFAPPDILPRVLGQFLFQAATMCDTGGGDERLVSELCHHYGLFSRGTAGVRSDDLYRRLARATVGR